ncbi:uncharacterized protein LOC143244324 [Tachypleus tridentatus]|uniref:uncharacterized protein LOC143244324 n=1 Tax=Tachypleus tridentatus TaxID=6853 RepID=UPI003FD613EE
MLDSSKRKALLEWVNCLGIGGPLDSLVQLGNGVDFLRIIHMFDPSSCEVEMPEDRFRIIARFLNEFYKTKTEMFIHYDKCLHGSELELAKTAVLLLCAAVQQSLCSSTQSLITSLTQLDEGVQKEIRECLEAVLLPGNNINGYLTADFVSVLSKQSLQNETTPRKHSCVNNLGNLRSTNKIKTASHYSSQGSPLRALLDSPLLVQRVAVREKEKELSCLRSRLVQQETQCIELEDKLHNVQKELADKEKEQVELRKTISELRKIKESVESASEYKVTADTYQEELEHLRYRLRDLENLKFINERVEADNQLMTDKQMQLETEVLNLREQLVNLRKKEQEEKEREGLIIQLSNNSRELEMEVKRLQEALQESQNELEKTCQFYSERAAASEEDSSPPKAFYPQGECMGGVFSDLRVSELESILEQLRLQLESQKEISQSLEREKTSIHNEVVSYTKKVEMLESQLCQSLSEKTVVEKELRDELEMLAIEKERTLELLRSTLDEKNKLLEDHTTVEQEKQKLEEDAKKLRMENKSLTQNFQDLQNEKCKIETDCLDKAEKVSCLEKELENLRALLSSAQKLENRLNSEYQTHLQECQKEKLIYCEKISTFESQINNLAVEKNEIQERFQKNIDELYQEVETKKQELKNIQVDFQVKFQHMQCIEAELNTRIDSLSQSNRESEELITEKHKEITQLKEEKENYFQEKLKLEMQLQESYEKLKYEEDKRIKLETEKNTFFEPTETTG